MPCGYYRHPSSAACFPAPSGCRLRGSPGLRGAARGERKIEVKHPGEFSGPPPPFFIVFYWPNDAKKRRISSRDLGAQNLLLLSIEILAHYAVGSRLLSVNLPKIGRSISSFSTFFLNFSPKSILLTRRPPAPPSVRRSNALCKESIR